MPTPDLKPSGRDFVRRALVEKAGALFAKRGIKAVSVREIAAAAGVNHGLVHRHFGSKGGLLRAVMTALADEVVEKIGPAPLDEALPDLLIKSSKATVNGGLHWRILARALLDGETPGELQHSFPVVARLMAAARRDNPSGLSDEALVTLIVTVSLGLLVFEPYLKLATGQSDAEWIATRRELSELAIKSVRP
jgi:AcrR family transcriptional regulator